MSEKKPMSQTDASRIQSSTDRKGGDADFKARAAAAAARNENGGKPPTGSTGNKR